MKVLSPQRATLANIPLVNSETQIQKEPQYNPPHLISDQVDISQNITVIEGAYRVVALTKQQLIEVS